MDVRGSKHQGPKKEKFDPMKLVDDKRTAHPTRPIREKQDEMKDVLGQSLLVRGTPKKIIEVVIQSE